MQPNDVNANVYDAVVIAYSLLECTLVSLLAVMINTVARGEEIKSLDLRHCLDILSDSSKL